MSTSAELPRLELRLNPNGVAAVAQRAVAFTAHAVATSLRSLAADELTPPDMYSELMGYNFPAPDVPPEQRRQEFQNWILGKGFQDLARGMREALEEAHFYIAATRLEPGPMTIGQFNSNLAAIRTAARRPNFPELLESVNAGLKEPLTFQAEFLSLQKARNCLEHRGGIVTDKEVDPVTGRMTMSFPRLKVYFLKGEEEVELAPGVIVDTHEHRPPFGADTEVPIFLRRVTRERDYQLGDALVITPCDFFEIAMACHLFGSDLASKLPPAKAGEGSEDQVTNTAGTGSPVAETRPPEGPL